MRIPVVIVTDLVALGAATVLVLIAAWLFLEASSLYVAAARLAQENSGTCVWMVKYSTRGLFLNASIP